MLEEVRAEAKAGFGGKAAPWIRTLRDEEAASPLERATLDETKLLDAVENELLADGAKTASLSDDLSAVLAQALAAELLTDDKVGRISNSTEANEAQPPRQVRPLDVEEGIRQAFKARMGGDAEA